MLTKFCLFTQHHWQLGAGFLKQTTPVSPPYRVSPIQPVLAKAVHTDGDDAYLIGSQSNQAGLVPVYLFPDCQCALSSETLYPAEEYYRLREILRNDPSAFDDQCDLFRSYPLDWYKELALYAMRCVARTHGSPMAESVHDQSGQTAHDISKAIFEEQDLFDPYTDAAFLAAAERILPWYIRRYVNR